MFRHCGTEFSHTRWWNNDAFGNVNLCVTWTLILGLGGFTFNVCVFSVQHISPFLFCRILAYNILLVLAFISHVKVAFTNPGAIPKNAMPTQEAVASGKTHYRCKHCNNFKPSRSHHCRICNRCITKMDHHCPWVNNCIGIRNQKFFFLFLMYTFIICLFCVTEVRNQSMLISHIQLYNKILTKNKSLK